MSDRDRWAMEHFKGICPYTGKPCDDWHCRECEVEKAEKSLCEHEDKEEDT